MNLNIKAEGNNEHHKIEGIFKALARAIKMAVRRIFIILRCRPAKGVFSDGEYAGNVDNMQVSTRIYAQACVNVRIDLRVYMCGPA